MVNPLIHLTIDYQSNCHIGLVKKGIKTKAKKWKIALKKKEDIDLTTFIKTPCFFKLRGFFTIPKKTQIVVFKQMFEICVMGRYVALLSFISFQILESCFYIRSIP